MKNLLLLLCFICLFAGTARSQTANIDTSLKFDHGYIDKQWVVLKKADTASDYTFGYVYIDSLSGLIFQKEGTFIIVTGNRYILNAADTKTVFNRRELFPGKGLITIMNPRVLAVATIPARHFKELKITAEPDWVKPYYNYTDTLAHNYRWACIYGRTFYTYHAIELLEKVYKVDPHYPGMKLEIDFGYYLGSQGVELKLAWAYNFTNQPDKAIAILNPAIAHNPNNALFFIILGRSYDEEKNWEMSINTYKQGLELMGAEKSAIKSDFAYGISNDYQQLNKLEEANSWHKNGIEYDPYPNAGHGTI